MKIFSNNVVGGYLDNRFGHHGSQFVSGTKVCTRSFHIGWADLPQNTKSLAMIFIDHDAIPVCGFSWIHWTLANIDPSCGELPENASIDLDLLQGITSFAAPIAPEDWRLSREDAIGYGGCAPPDKDHCYTSEIFALDTLLDLEPGFYANELINKMKGHILGQQKLDAVYRSKV
jgi:Raf kinase inhibitor-like YbhB/YbcL family protein